jgi:hypothetical protein
MVRIPPWTVYIERVVDRYMNNLRGRRFDPDDLLLDDYLLLVRCLEISLIFGSVAQLLYDSHNLIFLAQKGVSQLPCLVEFIAQGKKDVRKMTDRFYAWVPGLFLQGSIQSIAF